MKRILFCFLLLFLLIPINVFATSGYLRKDSIKECSGNLYGKHGSDNHWHVAIKNQNGSYSASGDALYNDPCPVNNNSDNQDSNLKNDNIINNEVNDTTNNNEIENTTVLDNDTTLKEIMINGENIPIDFSMEYKTVRENVEIIIKPNSEKSKAEYNKFSKLEIGNNIINITVTAENGDSAKYALIIVREKDLDSNKDLSSNFDIKIKIDGEEINFEDNKYSIEVNNKVNKLDLTYELASDTTKIKIIGNENFVTGKNEVKIIVTALDGSSNEYIITVTKLDFINSVIKIILGSSVVVAISAFFKKIKK